MVFCPYCGINAKDPEYCPECGEDILSKRLEKRSVKMKTNLIICPNCSANASFHDIYCENCGFAIKNSPPTSYINPVNPYTVPMPAQYVTPAVYRNPNKLYRSRRRRVIAGVCGGIGDKYAISPAIIRIIFIFSALFYGLGFLVYLILAIFVPAEPRYY